MRISYPERRVIFCLGNFVFYIDAAEKDFLFHKEQFLIHFPQSLLTEETLKEARPITLKKNSCLKNGWLTELCKALEAILFELEFSPFHGALLAGEGYTLIVSGPSGAGKSIFSLLSPESYAILADDLFFIREDSSGFSLIPLPRFIRTKCKGLPYLRRTVETPRTEAFVAKKFHLVFPRYSKQTAIQPIEDPEIIFQRLIAGNLYGNLQKCPDKAYQQLNIRKKLQFSKAWEFLYNDESAQETVSFFFDQVLTP